MKLKRGRGYSEIAVMGLSTNFKKGLHTLKIYSLIHKQHSTLFFQIKTQQILYLKKINLCDY